MFTVTNTREQGRLPFLVSIVSAVFFIAFGQSFVRHGVSLARVSGSDWIEIAFLFLAVPIEVLLIWDASRRVRRGRSSSRHWMGWQLVVCFLVNVITYVVIVGVAVI